jgi:hypothetical protein
MNGMQLAEYGQWYYLIYLLPGGFALLVLALSAIAGAGRHHGGGHHAGHQAVGGHAGHHGAGHHDAHAPVHPNGPKPENALRGAHHEAHLPRTAGENSNGPRTALEQVLSAFGFGRVPLPFIWGSALLGWGLFGFWSTRILESWLHAPSRSAVLVAFVAAFGAGLTTRFITGTAARLMPQDESYATSTVDLCGQIGTVAFEVTEARGRVHVYDAHGTLHDSLARTAAGRGPIARGRKVLIADYDPSRDQLIVEEME